MLGGTICLRHYNFFFKYTVSLSLETPLHAGTAETSKSLFIAQWHTRCYRAAYYLVTDNPAYLSYEFIPINILHVVG